MTGINYGGFTLAKGKELVGEDAFFVKKFSNFLVAAVCDGVSASKEGRLAACKTIEFLKDSFAGLPLSWDMEKSVKYFVRTINRILFSEGMNNYGYPEYLTTLSLVVVRGGRLYGANIGDGRIYLYRDGLHKLSVEHVLKNDEKVLTEALGMKEETEIYYFENNLKIGDKLLLCSDGLYELLEEEEMVKGINIGASHLVKLASKKVEDDLPDDTTAVVIEINEIDEKEKLKKLDLPIAKNLKEGMKIDGFSLIKSFNDRTFLAVKNGEKVVLKFAPSQAVLNEKILDDYVKEAVNAVKMDSDFFPKCKIPDNRSFRYYVMEYAEGKNLSEEKLSMEESVELAKTLLRASQYLLRRDLVHGDVKPENIIKTEKGFKLVDFGGVTEIFSDVCKKGTPSFMAPERFEGAPVSEITEIFSIGVCLYKVLTDKFPYGEIEPFQKPSFKKPMEPKEINPDVPDWLNGIVLKAIQIDKNKRYQTYSEMLFDLNYPKKIESFFPLSVSYEETQNYKIYFILSLILNILLIFVLLY